VVEMRAKAVLAVMLAMLIAVAALPQAWAGYGYAQDLTVKLIEEYKEEGLLPQDAPDDLRSAHAVEKIILEKYNRGGLNSLTADEAYVFLNRVIREVSFEEEKELWLELAEKYPQYPPAWEGLAYNAEEAGDVALMFYAYTRYLELVPNGKVPGAPEGRGVGGVWSWLADSLEEYGYAAAAEFPRRVYEERLYEQLHTRDDLRKIGFYEWREKYIMPMYEQRGTLKGDLQAKLARLNALTFGRLYIAPILLVVTVLVLGYIFLKLFFAGGKRTLVSFAVLAALMALVYHFDLYLVYTLLFVVANPVAALAAGMVALIVLAVALAARKHPRSAA
jgi:hypothetical protein